MALTRDQILNSNDIHVKEVQVPEWGDSVFIKQLTRAQQDEYLQRQYGATRLKQDNRAKAQEISDVNIYGHDAYLCACGICDEEGKPLFKASDIDALRKKNGAAIGRIAAEILKFSIMDDDVNLEDEIKN